MRQAIRAIAPDGPISKVASAFALISLHVRCHPCTVCTWIAAGAVQAIKAFIQHLSVEADRLSRNPFIQGQIGLHAYYPELQPELIGIRALEPRHFLRSYRFSEAVIVLIDLLDYSIRPGDLPGPPYKS